jgi:CubicO group peptidase (beta-lactamase class C family)
MWVWRFLAIGAAYKSKILCTAIFGSALNVDLNTADEVTADAYWFLRIFHARVDRGGRSVTTTFVGLRPRTAIHRNGLGATLIKPGLKSRPTCFDDSTTCFDDSTTCFDDSTTYFDDSTYVGGGVGGDVGRDFSPAGIGPTAPSPKGHGSPALQHFIERAFDEPNPQRLRRTRAIVVVQDGRIVGERYAPGITAHTPLPGWSMTKSVLGSLVGILVEEGKLSLDETELLPEWKRPDARAEIRFEDLLRMRSGLRFVENYANPASDVVRMLFEQPDSARFAASLPLAAKPGTVWSYSSGTTNIISRIVRERVGADYLDWPRRVLFDPIGMTSAVMEPDASGTFVCSSFMLATARDWARFGQLHVQEGMWEGRTVVPRRWIDYMTTPTPESDRQSFGAHWWLKISPELGGDTPDAGRIPADAYFALGHEGQTLTIVPSRRLVIVRLGLSIYIDAWNHARFVTDVIDHAS